MNINETGSGINALKAVAAISGVILLAVVLFCFIRPHLGSSTAERKVAQELDLLKTSDYMGSEVAGLRASLSEDGREDFDEFVDKLKDFDYEITGSSEINGNDESHILVGVRINTYDFGREYLSAWTDYIKENSDALSSGSDFSDFYEMLFDRLSDLEDKESFRNVDIVCIDPIDNGEWIANVRDNEDLQDAVFGGMMSEMKTLAAD